MKDIRIELMRIGKACKLFRKKVLELSQTDVAKELGYARQTVGMFEEGKTNNAYILAYYLEQGMKLGKWLAWVDMCGIPKEEEDGEI